MSCLLSMSGSALFLIRLNFPASQESQLPCTIKSGEKSKAQEFTLGGFYPTLAERTAQTTVSVCERRITDSDDPRRRFGCFLPSYHPASLRLAAEKGNAAINQSNALDEMEMLHRELDHAFDDFAPIKREPGARRVSPRLKTS